MLNFLNCIKYMKAEKLVIIVSDKKGDDCYEVLLTDEERGYVFGLLSHIHNGKIKCLNKKIEVVSIK